MLPITIFSTILSITLLLGFILWELLDVSVDNLSFSAKIFKKYIIIEKDGRFYPNQQNRCCFIPVKSFFYLSNSSYDSHAHDSLEEARNCIEEHCLSEISKKLIAKQGQPKYHSYQKAKAKPEVK